MKDPPQAWVRAGLIGNCERVIQPSPRWGRACPVNVSAMQPTGLEVLNMVALSVALTVGFLLGVLGVVLIGLIAASSKNEVDASHPAEILQISKRVASPKEKGA